jgi:hypothetical protein
MMNRGTKKLQHLFAEFLPMGEIQLGRQFSRKIHRRQKRGGRKAPQMQEGNPWMKHRGRDERLGGTPGVEERLGSAIVHFWFAGRRSINHDIPVEIIGSIKTMSREIP